VLKFLYRAEGPVPRNTLLHEIWGYSANATTHTVETHIYRLRRKLEHDPSKIALLVNESGGYRLGVEQSPPVQICSDGCGRLDMPVVPVSSPSG
jgi:DNA-binding response OmpR family regulator